MRDAPVGLVGAFAANRPYLSLGVLAAGLSTLAIVGARQADAGDLIASLALAALCVIVAPMALAALTPRRGWSHAGFIVLVAGLAVAAAVTTPGAALLTVDPAAMRGAALGGLGLFLFLVSLSPLARNVTALAAPASFAAALGAAGASGYLALEGFLDSQSGAIAAAFALTFGVAAGVHIAADFARFYTQGASRKVAAAAAGHNAAAPAVFALLVTVAFFIVHSHAANFGAVDWRMLWAGVTMSAAAVATAFAGVTGGLALMFASEQIAVDENRRRQWFSRRWRPIRLALPTATAVAATAIAGIFVVIAAFESGVAAPGRLAVFLALIWTSAAVAFVSLRSASLVALLLGVGAVLAEYALSVIGLDPPAQSERFAGLSLAAVALAALTASWRDAGDTWRNARDIVENALSDGLRRYLFIVGVGAAAVYAASMALPWPTAPATVIYFLSVALIALILAPAAMTAMSARLGDDRS